jgi:predicted phosphodiesterase
MKAILSCIHGNLEALQAVIADAASKGATEIVCLGDLIGYGPNPVECVNLSMLWPIVLQGNFDAAALYEVDFAGWTAVIAANSVRWFQGLMKESEEGARCAVFLSKRPHIHHEGKFVFVHGTPCARRNLFEYVLPEDIWNSKKMARIGESFDGHCFNGHTHVAGLFIEAAGEWTYLNPKDCDYHYQFSSQKTI